MLTSRYMNLNNPQQVQPKKDYKETLYNKAVKNQRQRGSAQIMLFSLAVTYENYTRFGEVLYMFIYRLKHICIYVKKNKILIRKLKSK